jgi:hypothetical protein
MNQSSTSTIAGVFNTTSDARKAFDELRKQGFTENHIGVIGRDDNVRHEITGSSEQEATAGATAGAVTGAGIGLLWGFGVVANLIPAVGPAIAAGTFAALASSAAAGAATLGVAGALIGWGMSSEDASYYESEVKSGRILLTVHAEGRRDEAEAIIRRNGGSTELPQRGNS